MEGWVFFLLNLYIMVINVWKKLYSVIRNEYVENR